MKIIQLIYSISSGGAEKFVVDLSNQLAVRGHEVILCILRDDTDKTMIFNKQFLNSNVRFYSMKFQSGFSWNKCRKLSKYIESEMPDVVHCHLNVIPYIYIQALFNRKILFVHTLHNVASQTVGIGLQYYLNYYFYKHHLIHPICISKICQKSFELYYRLNAPFIDNGRAVVAVSSNYEIVKREVNSFKTTNNTLVFIHVARFNPQKNQQLLIDSFNRLDNEKIDFVLLIIGNGYDSEEGRRLQHSACSKIHFLGNKNNVIDYFNCSDAFCLTSIYEGLPISLLEALSCGVTPICTSVGGIPDVIIDNVYGYLSTDQSVDGYCKAIKRFISKPLLSQRLIDYFNINYSMEVCVNKYEEIYKMNRL